MFKNKKYFSQTQLTQITELVSDTTQDKTKKKVNNHKESLRFHMK